MQFDRNAKKPASAPPPVTPQQRATLLFNQALRATQQGKRAESEKLYRQMLALDPNAAVGWANLGLLLSQQKRYEEAIACLQKAIRLTPKESAFIAQLASIEWNAKRADEALVTAREALAQDPTSADALRVLCAVLFSQKRYAEALAPLAKWAELRPNELQALGMLATTQLRAEKPGDALVTLRLMNKRFPKEVNALLMHGDLAGQLGAEKKDKALLREARDAYLKAFALTPNNLRAGINAGLAAEQLDDIPGARALFEKLRQKSPDDALVHHRLGLLYLRDLRLPAERRVTLAVREVEAAVAKEPRNPEYVSSLGYLYLVQGSRPENGTKASGMFRAALKSDPKNARAKRGLAEALLVAQDWNAAATALRDLLTDTPNDDALRQKLASALNAAGKRGEATLELRTIARHQPKETKTLKELAGLLEQDGNLDEAEKTLEEALGRDPGDITTLVRLGQLETRQKKYSVAHTRFEGAIAKQPENNEVNAGLIALLEAQGKTDEALAARERWVKADPKNNQARYELGMTYAAAGKDTEALATLKQLTLRQGDPNRALHRQALAEFFHRRGRFTDEASEVRNLLQEEPNNEALKNRLADVLEKAGQFDEADRTWTQLIQSVPASALKYRLARIGLYERSGKLPKAAEELEDLVTLRTDSEEARAMLLRVRTTQKHPEFYSLFLEKVALAEPYQPNPNLVAALDTFYRDQKQPEKYLAFTRHATEVFPKNPPAWRLYANALQRETASPATRSEAIRCWKQVTELDITDGAAPLFWGKLLEEQGKRTEAIAAYTLSVQRQRSPEGIASLKRLGAPIPPEPKKPPKK